MHMNIMGMCAIAIGRFHYQDFWISSSGSGPARTTRPGELGLHGHTPHISAGEDKLSSVCRVAEEELDHGGAKSMPCMDKPKSELWINLHDLMEGNRFE